MSKLPSFQFYPGDWMKDPALAICSTGARGVLVDVLCLMFEAPRRGYLLTNGHPWTIEQIASAIRGDWNENVSFLKELLRNGVIKQDKKGCFFSSRLARDEHQREEWRSQKRRQLIEKKRSHSVPYSTLVPPVLHSSSSSSSSTSVKTEREEFALANFEIFWLPYPNKIDRDMALILFLALSPIDQQKAAESIVPWVKSEKWDDPKFIPSPVTFLKKRRWEYVPKTKIVEKPLHEQARDLEKKYRVS